MSALRILFGCWALAAAAFIEFYARRYEFAGTPLWPDGLLAALALSALFLPRGALARAPLPPNAARAIAASAACAVALLFAVRHPLQLAHVLTVSMLPALALAALAPALLRPGPPRYARFAATAVLSALTFVLLVYYAVLVVGLETWSEIVTRELIHVYAPHVPELVDALPVSPWHLWAGVAALLAVLVLAYGLASRGIVEGVRAAARQARAYLAPAGAARAKRWAAVLLMAAAYLLIADAAHYLSHRHDPLITTFLGEPRPRGTPTLPFRPNPALDALERDMARRYAAPAGVAGRTIVLVTVDALRADQMNVYGHARENTPFLSRLHREGRLARFDDVFAACTESLCGLLAILNSRYWHEMGMGRRHFGLADALKRLGYRVHFVLGGDHTHHWGLRFFYGDSVDRYVDGSFADDYMNDDAEVIDQLRRLDASAGAPVFIYAHFMSVHQVGTRDPRLDLWRGMPVDARDATCCSVTQDYINRYHQGIRRADAMLEEMFAILAEKGLLRDALVAITADHGEWLGEYGYRLGHGGPPLDPAVRVPLLIYDAQGFDYPRPAPASVVDVAPTLLERIGAPVPGHWSGSPLTRAGARRFVLMQSRERIAVVGAFDGTMFKYYRALGSDAWELVRIAGAGREQPVAASDARPEILRDLRAELDRRVPALRLRR